MKLSPYLQKAALAALTFFGTLLVLSVGYATWNPTMPHVAAGSGLLSSSWNTIVDNLADLNTRVTSYPIFSAYLNQASSASSNTWTKIPFNATEIDTSSAFNTTTSRFQPTMAGYYHVTVAAYMNGTAAGGSTYYVALYKNSTAVKYDLNIINWSSTFSQT
jgi:hypothetical protein